MPVAIEATRVSVADEDLRDIDESSPVVIDLTNLFIEEGFNSLFEEATFQRPINGGCTIGTFDEVIMNMLNR